MKYTNCRYCQNEVKIKTVIKDNCNKGRTFYNCQVCDLFSWTDVHKKWSNTNEIDNTLKNVKVKETPTWYKAARMNYYDNYKTYNYTPRPENIEHKLQKQLTESQQLTNEILDKLDRYRRTGTC